MYTLKTMMPHKNIQKQMKMFIIPGGLSKKLNDHTTSKVNIP